MYQLLVENINFYLRFIMIKNSQTTKPSFQPNRVMISINNLLVSRNIVLIKKPILVIL
jgi:hypothetical protein